MKKTSTKRLIDIFTVLADYEGLNMLNHEKTVDLTLADGRILLEINEAGIYIPGITIPDYFENHPSALDDWSVPISQIETFMSVLSAENSFLHLNHLGFYYEVESLEDEKARLLNEVEDSKWNLYEEKTEYEEKWLYIGDITDWQDPVVEFAISAPRTDEWKKYQIPQIHIDINTKIDGFFIEKAALKVFEGKVIPFHPIMSKGKPVMTKVWVGTAGGVNMFLDFGTNLRQPKWHRVRMLKKINKSVLLV